MKTMSQTEIDAMHAMFKREGIKDGLTPGKKPNPTMKHELAYADGYKEGKELAKVRMPVNHVRRAQ